MFNWFGRKSRPPKEVAKDRLRLVLMQDRMSLAPHIMEKMKDEVILAISKYCEIDEPNIEFCWKEVEKEKALVANIPIVSVKRGK